MFSHAKNWLQFATFLRNVTVYLKTCHSCPAFPNYGRWGPFYVADMLDLQSTDPETWKFLDEGNFSLQNTVSLSLRLIQTMVLNRSIRMKVKGGFIGITGKEYALEKYVIIAPHYAELFRNSKTMLESKHGNQVLFTVNLLEQKVLRSLQMQQMFPRFSPDRAIPC